MSSMMSVPRIEPGGMTVAMLTPYDAAGRVDLGAASEHAAWLVERGIRTLAPVGTTGEVLYLTAEEKQSLVNAVAEAVRGRAAVMAGIWALRLEEIRDLHAAAVDAGAVAVFLTTPIYYPAGDDSVVAFYEWARSAGPLPVYAYSIPQYAANEVSLTALKRLAESGTVSGIKDSSGMTDRLAALMSQFGDRLAVYGASDSMALQARQMSAHGFISALANIFPGTFLQIWEGGDGSVPDEAAAAQATADRLRGAVKGYGGIAALKYLLARRGLRCGGARLPFQELDAAARSALDRVWDELGAAE
jgi:dihydrodipicolinate synthase/N-acetylneuraminate lyase